MGRRVGEVVLEVGLDERRGNDGMAGSGVTRSSRGYQPQPRSRREKCNIDSTRARRYM